ncbi:MAG: hypothetical protein QG610_1477 [Euryarchaeota archaeon]|nr:hypothetical protein [Euryarchaeota archaeon]
MPEGEFSMNYEKIKSTISSKIKKIESELPLNIIIYFSIFLLTLAVVVDKNITIPGFNFDLKGLYPLGIFSLISLASLLCGLLVGFIFGLPRVISENTSFYSNMYGDNSNLDQISDWLLKILIGVGLAQLGKLKGALVLFAGSVNGALNSTGSEMASSNMAGSGMVGVLLLIIFSVGGFLFGYLCTRHYAPILFMEGISKQHNIEGSMDKDKEDIKKNTQEVVSENRKIIESIQNNQDNFCKWMEKITKQMNLFEENQKRFNKLHASDPSLQAVLDCTYPVDGKECLEKIKTLRNKIKNPVQENISNKDPLIQDSSNSCQNTDAKSKLQEKMKTNKNEITEYTNKLSNENREIMKKIESNQKDFAIWMGIFEDRLKAITDNQAYINNFCIIKKQQN